MTNEDKLRAFVLELFKDWPHEFGVDGFDLQDLAEKHGLIVPHEATEPCGEYCACAEYDDFPQTCYRKTPLLTGERSAEETSVVPFAESGPEKCRHGKHPHGCTTCNPL